MHIRNSSFYEYHDLAYKIFRIGSFSDKTVFSCLLELPGNKKSQGHKFRIDCYTNNGKNVVVS